MKEGWLNKVYKILFIVYAPIFIVYFIWSKIAPLSYWYLIGGVVVASVVMTLIIAFTYYREYLGYEIAEHLPFMLRHQFLVPYIIILLLSFFGTSLFIYNQSSSNALKNHVCSVKTRIVLMLPCNNNLGAAWEDGVKQILGLTYFFRDNPDYTSKYEFRIIDHAMSYDTKLKEAIKEEIAKGTKIFISSMSQVSEPLSEDFPNLVKDVNYSGEKPILICTITSSPHISTSIENRVLRFYIRSQEEGLLLAQEGRKLNFKNAGYIVVNDFYGEGAIREFQENWQASKGVILGGVQLSRLADEEKVLNELKKEVEVLRKSDVIFVAHYGSGVDKIFRALDRLEINIPVLATHTLTIPDWQKPIKNILQKRQSYSCLPAFVAKFERYPEIVYQDAISGFMYLTLDKTIKCLEETKGDFGSFTIKWQTIYPEIMSLRIAEKGDIAIGLDFIKIDVR